MKVHHTFKLLGSRLALCAAFLLLLVSPIFAQTESARLQGTVTDQSGAALPGATVTVTDIATNRVVTTQANESGEYSVPSLSPGRYRIEVTQANFKTTRQEVTLEIQQAAVINFQLEAGGVSEVVEVTSEAPLVEAASSAVGEVVQGRQIVELPLNGRNVLELARLVPGVTQGVPGGFSTGVGGNAETFRGRNTGGAALSVNGQRTQANNFLLDGVDNNESLVNTIQIFPQADAVQEFRVQTSVAPAEFGRGGGGIVNAVVRSGSNDFFGSAYTFIRNDNFDARPTFDATKSEFRRGQFGGTIGGPLYLPRFGEGGPAVLSGKNRAFFFADYEGLRQFLPIGTRIVTVPTPEFRRGNFAALLDPASNGLGRAIQLRDPLTGQPVPGNRLDLLPGNRLNPVALNYLNAFPLPNRGGSGVIRNYQTNPAEITDQDTFDIRIDGNISQRNQMFGRFSWGRAIQSVGSFFPTLPAGFGTGDNFNRSRALVLGATTVISQKSVNELRLNASRINFGYQPPFFGERVSAGLGIPNANLDSLRGGGALIGGFATQIEYTGDEGLYTVPQNTYQVVDNLSYTTGNHTFRFGGTVLRREVNLFRPRFSKGFFLLFGNGENPASTGFEQADLLIGFVSGYLIGPPFGTVGTRNWENAVFAQDDWRATRKLTFNLGLRYEYFTNPTEVYGRQSNFDISTGQLILARDASDPLVNNDKNNFSPRVGFAYDIGGDGRTVIRGGYGLFYFLERGGISNQLAQNPPFSGTAFFGYDSGVRITLSGRAPDNTNDSRLATGPLPTGEFRNFNPRNPLGVDVLAILPENKTSNVHQFNVQFQRQLTNDTAVSVGYVGTRGRNLANYFNFNGTRFGGRARPFPNLGRVTIRDDSGRSSYDSLQTQVERRFTRGLQYLMAYTFSRTEDNGSGAFDALGANNIFRTEAYGRSRLDFPHVFSFSSIYDIPFGRGRRFGSDMARGLDFIVGGWQLNSILRLQSGQPFDVRTNDDDVLVDLVGDPYGTSGDFYLNRAAFQRVPSVGGVPTRNGNLERNSLRGPAQKQLNVGLAKNFSLTEEARIQFRTEFFNVTNTPQLGTPNTNIEDVNNFGRFQESLRFTNRQIQFGLRLEF